VTGGAAGDVILNPAPIRLPTPSLYYKIVKTGATSVLNYIVTQAYENSNGG
jgi:hypothetical protein